MDDCEKITNSNPEQQDPPCDVHERDDFGGMLLNMLGKLDIRALMIVWISFIFLHTELCAENFMKKISGAINEDCSLTMKGTIYASFMMTFVVMLCMIVF